VKKTGNARIIIFTIVMLLIFLLSYVMLLMHPIAHYQAFILHMPNKLLSYAISYQSDASSPAISTISLTGGGFNNNNLSVYSGRLSYDDSSAVSNKQTLFAYCSKKAWSDEEVQLLEELRGYWMHLCI